MAHRILALLIAIGVIVFCLRALRGAPGILKLRRLANLWVALVVCQIALGAWTIWSNKAADVATTHVAVGAIMLSFGVSISAICWRVLAVTRHGGREASPAGTGRDLPSPA
jgi:cytochrome c oxidase assembly protein subunit 15